MSDPNEIEMANYNCPLGKSDHMVGRQKRTSRTSKEGTTIVNQASTCYFIFFFWGGGNVDWSRMHTVDTIQEKYEILINVYEEGVKNVLTNKNNS